MSFFVFFFFNFTSREARNYRQMRISDVFIPEWRFQLGQNLMWKREFVLQYEVKWSLWCLVQECCNTAQNAILLVCASYTQSIADKSTGMMENVVWNHIETSNFQLLLHVDCFLSFPFFLCCPPCPLFVTFHTFKNLVIHSKPWGKKKKGQK